MTEPITARDLAHELAEAFDIDRNSALTSVEIYLEQLSAIDDNDIDSEDIGDEQADAVRAAFEASLEVTHVSALDDLAEIREKLDSLAELQDDRIRLVRKALTAGARVVDITAASGLTRARIYQIKDGR